MSIRSQSSTRRPARTAPWQHVNIELDGRQYDVEPEALVFANLDPLLVLEARRNGGSRTSSTRSKCEGKRGLLDDGLRGFAPALAASRAPISSSPVATSSNAKLCVVAP